MTEQPPAIRIADKDGDGPAKRRRRPALSCAECRNRKVRCDRREPCGSCTRLRSETCTYRPQRPGIRPRSPADTSASASGTNDQDHGNSARSSPQQSAPSNEFHLMVNRYVAPGIFGEHGKPQLTPLPVHRPNLTLNSHSESSESALIAGLLERIRSLESRETARVDRSASTSSTIPEGQDNSTGRFIKSKFYGQSHWVNAIEPYDALGDGNTTVNHNTNRREVNKKTELYGTVIKIKQMARIIKTSRMMHSSLSQEIQDSVPAKEVCDALIECYLRTFEGVFRVLHVPSFRKEYESYWIGLSPTKPSVTLKILLACAIGVPFYSGPDQPSLRTACAKWIQAAAQWLSGPHAKSKLNMTGLQIQILHLLARQVCSVDGDHIWIPAGTLLRTAMHLGLHRDPANFSNISVYHREMRRRLWATVLEITAQSSLDMGMPPMISVNDYDTKAPSNINDEDIGEGLDKGLDEKQPDEYTDSSIQITFTETLPVRLEIIRLINNLRFDLSYDDVLKIGSDLNDACRSQTIFLKSALNAGHAITPFQIKMADSLVRRFVLCLHRPYFAKAKENPQYHYSRKMCLDTSLAIYAPATELLPGQEDDWTRMTHRCVGFFKSFFLYAMSTVYMELNSQIDEQKHASAIFAPLISTNPASSSRPFALPTQFHTLRDVLVSAHETAIARLRNGETNAKGAVFLACALARLDALASGEDADRAVLEAAKKSVTDASRILTEVYQAEHGVPIDLKISISGEEHSRGDGADDVTGRGLQTGTDVSGGVDLPIHDNLTPELGSAMGAGMNGMDLLGDGVDGLNGLMDMDLDAYLAGQTLDPGSSDYHFGRSPEWFYDLNGWAATGTFGTGFAGM
ncbi:hypothetical protein FB567DRAFT_530667 [Paraphoma chrysanthemicola]|uniref:Zn(2)-C6 fungal-type domain-containing protein n=1 Tax=Paraphoma chrysanthemicola TaxID=798071 RepID=A0A8K0R1A6_9PLEO|nr:hypothetical protein FB567DRAFT_530667 [Paraphoma chrysanthemicola]